MPQAALALARRELPKVLDKLSGDDPEHATVQRLATSTMGLLAYPDPTAAPMAHLLTDAQRGRTADVVNTFLLSECPWLLCVRVLLCVRLCSWLGGCAWLRMAATIYAWLIGGRYAVPMREQDTPCDSSFAPKLLHPPSGPALVLAPPPPPTPPPLPSLVTKI